MSVRPHPTKWGKDPGQWWIVDTGRGGDRLRTTFRGQFEDAKKLENDIVANTNKTTRIAQHLKVIDIVLDFYQHHAQEVSQTTLADVRVVFSRRIIPFFGRYRTMELTKDMISAYKHERVEIGKVKARTVNKELSYFSSFLRYAREYKGVETQPGFSITMFRRGKTVSPPAKAVSPRVIDAMAAVMEPQYQLIFLLMADAGLRQREALHLTAESVDERNKTIQVYGKGSKYRAVPFTTDRLENALMAALAKRPAGYLSINEITGKPFYGIRKALLRAARAANVPFHIHHHLLRHSCLSNMAMDGMNPHAIQQIAGHSSIETTNKIYTHIRHDFVREEVEKIRSKNR